jgi:ABC-type iron transport system FetAB ATPase subunit
VKDKLKPAHGNWVDGDRFFDREREMELFLEKIRDRAHLLLVAQRRMGKTSLMREAKRILEGEKRAGLRAGPEEVTPMSRPMKYNPALLSDEEIVAQFAARQAELKTVLEVVEGNTESSNQHLLVIGPRGAGKSMLLHRVLAEIRRSEALSSRWIPVPFAEESFEVASPGQLWLQAIYHMGTHTHVRTWSQAYEELRAEPDEQRLRERALSLLLDHADHERKRLVLVVENLHLLLGEQLTEKDAWVLRHTLSNEPRIMLLASATHGFDAVGKESRALYEMFRVLRLEPLDLEDCGRLWRSVTGGPANDVRVRPVQILTGGSPRLISILGTFAQSRSLRELLNDLTFLVDDHTEYFKSRLESLPAKERKVFVSLAELWDPSDARTVAAASRLNVNETSALLGRLESRGAVTSEQEKRTKYYQVAERLFNIYYLFRRQGTQAQRLRFLADFLVRLYESQGLPPPKLSTTTAKPIDELVVRMADSAGGCAGNLSLLVELAATGHGEEALEIVAESPSAALLEPMVVALRLHLGEEVRVAAEIREVAEDLVKRIRERAQELKKERRGRK